VKAITVWQPSATLIALRLKPYEFRGWRAPDALIGRRIAIHAAARPVRRSEVEEIIARLTGPDPRRIGLLPEALPLLETVLAKLDAGAGLDGQPLPLSHVVCTAVLGAPLNGLQAVRNLGAQVRAAELTRPVNFAWPMLDVQPLEPPVPARGQQGLWDWAS